MITCNIMGGLGNQLFQIFSTISYAIDNKTPFYFYRQDKYGKRISYWYTMFQKIKPFTKPHIVPADIIVSEKYFHYESLSSATNLSQSICLKGYFQSYKYFEHNFDTIVRMLDINTFKKEFQKDDFDFANTVSLHFRLGDYKDLQDCHPVMSYEYYENSIQHIVTTLNKQSLKIYYFCEKDDNDIALSTINKLKEKYPDCEFHKVHDNVCDWKQMLLMSCFNHNIIANSSFSWWGAYFNNNENKIVCYPEKWFGPKLAHNNTKDLCPPNWNKIGCNEV